MASNGRRALVVTHEPGGGPAVLGRALEARGWTLAEHVVTDDPERPLEPNPFPTMDGHDLLVVMGSVHSVYDRSMVGAWIDDELELLRSAHQRSTPVLGVCFGAQALAAALGGSVELSPITEIGWYSIEGENLPIDAGPWLQWHHDRLVPPVGAEIVATTPETVQLYRVGRSVGAQFHPEVDVAHVRAWLHTAPDEYLARHGVDPVTFLAEVSRWERNSITSCGRLVDWFLSTVDLC